MSWHPRQLAQQIGRTFVITGANSGIGLAAARDLVARGAHVILAVRDTRKGEQARATLTGQGTSSVAELDLADLDSVASFAKTLTAERGDLSALVCNAGVMGGPFQVTPQGFERQMATNHLGHVALVSGLWPLLHAGGARVVMVSSIAARGGRLSTRTTRQELVEPSPYDAGLVYRNTKQANLLFAQELARRTGHAGSPVTAVAAHPGVSSTNLFPRLLSEVGQPRLVSASRFVMRLALQSAEAGALPTLRALDSATPSGAFVGPARFGQVRGRPELLDVYPSGKDSAVAERLWEVTEDILGHPLPV